MPNKDIGNIDDLKDFDELRHEFESTKDKSSDNSISKHTIAKEDPVPESIRQASGKDFVAEYSAVLGYKMEENKVEQTSKFASLNLDQLKAKFKTTQSVVQHKSQDMDMLEKELLEKDRLIAELSQKLNRSASLESRIQDFLIQKRAWLAKEQSFESTIREYGDLMDRYSAMKNEMDILTKDLKEKDSVISHLEKKVAKKSKNEIVPRRLKISEVFQFQVEPDLPSKDLESNAPNLDESVKSLSIEVASLRAEVVRTKKALIEAKEIADAEKLQKENFAATAAAQSARVDALMSEVAREVQKKDQLAREFLDLRSSSLQELSEVNERFEADRIAWLQMQDVLESKIVEDVVQIEKMAKNEKKAELSYSKLILKHDREVQNLKDFFSGKLLNLREAIYRLKDNLIELKLSKYGLSEEFARFREFFSNDLLNLIENNEVERKLLRPQKSQKFVAPGVVSKAEVQATDSVQLNLANSVLQNKSRGITDRLESPNCAIESLKTNESEGNNFFVSKSAEMGLRVYDLSNGQQIDELNFQILKLRKENENLLLQIDRFKHAEASHVSSSSVAEEISSLKDRHEMEQNLWTQLKEILEKRILDLDAQVLMFKDQFENSRALVKKLEFKASYGLADEQNLKGDSALNAALARSTRQVNKLAEILSDMENKYVERQIQYVNAFDQLNSLDAENISLKELIGKRSTDFAAAIDSLNSLESENYELRLKLGLKG